MKNQNIDEIWESEIYGKGQHLNLYPFDAVVSFVFGRAPRNQPRADTRIIEIGCGSANNLWFAAREGFDVAGIDGSPTAIASAKSRFEREGLHGDLRVGSFESLPWDDQSCDLAIDRHALVCVSPSVQKQAVDEVHRVLRSGGLFLSCGYSDRHTSASSGTLMRDGRTTDIIAGTLTGVGNLTFSTRREMEALFATGWEIESLEHVDIKDLATPGEARHTEWRVVARKI